MPELSVQLLIFMFLGTVVLACAIYAVILVDLIRAGYALIFSLATLGGIYIVLGNDFLGAVQILLYTGAIAVLVLFVVMLTRKSVDGMGRAEKKQDWIWGGVLSGGLFLLLFIGINKHKDFASGLPPIVPQSDLTLQAFGMAFTEEYFVPLQIMGVLLTAAFIGAALIARPEKKGDESGKDMGAGS
ncbi:MAG: NADH-quinone oxidoreductase subunit J [Verrucomicrobiota bacterium]|nr:NADH-quinone oxidoreductase subunit J [Verrucomicrobiota bacterium]